MNAYSEDLRRKIVEAVERGMPKAEAARAFGVGVSSVKRYFVPTAACSIQELTHVIG
jgi:transposase